MLRHQPFTAELAATKPSPHRELGVGTHFSTVESCKVLGRAVRVDLVARPFFRIAERVGVIPRFAAPVVGSEIRPTRDEIGHRDRTRRKISGEGKFLQKTKIDFSVVGGLFFTPQKNQKNASNRRKIGREFPRREHDTWWDARFVREATRFWPRAARGRPADRPLWLAASPGRSRRRPPAACPL
jgi:hypothetical protein